MFSINNNYQFMKKTLGIVAAVLVIIIAVLVANSANKPDTDNLKVGVIAPLSGDFAGVGENVVKGIQTAKIVYEEKTGNKIEVIVENDAADAAKGLSAYKKLTETNGINGLINVFTSTMDAIYEPTKAAGYPIMMEFFQANNVADDHVFQMTPGNDGTWDKYAAYIKKSGVDDSNFVLVHSKDAAQESFAKAFEGFYDGKITDFTASSDRNGLRTDAAKIAALKPTVILFIMTPENGAIMTKELAPLLSPDTKLFYDLQIVTGLQFYKDQLGGDLSKINGATSIALEGEPNQEFIDAYHKLYNNEEPGFLADFGYDTFLVYLESYDKDNGKWTENLKEVNRKGASGQIRFDQVGVRIPDLGVKRVENGQLVTVDRLPF
jgi:branched-chain amino acid transport system substrate-binding protein